MDVTITIPDEKLNEIVKNESSYFSKDELHDIMKEAITKYLDNSDFIKSMFIQKSLRSYYNDYEYVPTQLLTGIVQNIDINKDLEEIKDMTVDIIKNNMVEILAVMFAKSIASNIINSCRDTGELEHIIFDSVKRMNGN